MFGDTTHSILRRLIGPTEGDFSQAFAERVLAFSFSEADQERIQELAEKNTEDQLTPDERREYEGYVFVGEFLALMQAKARQSIHPHPSAA